MSGGGQRVAAWDGLRALAVAAVVVYHLDSGWLPGGFLGVSLFFTLSGWLIVGQLVEQLGSRNRLELAEFWGRRVRRLLPAALVTVAAVIATSPLLLPAQRAQVRGDAIATLGNVTNWWLLHRHVVYGGADPAPSPLRHAWSLSIEEQFYLVIPVLLLGAWRLGRRRGVTAALLALTIGSVVAGVLRASHPDVAYLRTETRAAEILIGGVCAVAMSGRVRQGLARWAKRLWPIAIVGVGAAWATTGESTRVLPRGGFAVHAVGSAVLIVAANQAGVLQRALSLRPLVAIGRVSYAVYLFHWPLALILTEQRLGVGAAPRALIVIAATAVAAAGSWWLVERPAQRRLRPRRAVAGWIPVTLLAIAAAWFALPATRSDDVVALPAVEGGAEIIGLPAETVPAETVPAETVPAETVPAETVLAETLPRTTSPHAATASSATTTHPPSRATAPAAKPPTSRATLPAAKPPTTTTSPRAAPTSTAVTNPRLTPTSAATSTPTSTPARPPTILVSGDSTAWSIAVSAVRGDPPHGLARWGAEHATAVFATNGTFGCGLSSASRYRWVDGIVFTPARCQWRTDQPAALDKLHPDAVVLLTGLWELTDRSMPGDSAWRSILDPRVAMDVESSLREWIELHRQRQIPVIVVITPTLRVCGTFTTAGRCPFAEEDPDRLEALRRIERRVAAQLTVPVIELQPLLEAHGHRGASALRDGVHWSPAGADRDAPWLGPIILDALRATSSTAPVGGESAGPATAPPDAGVAVPTSQPVEKTRG